jgi:NRPS condensation-like uncharacterized protein
LKLHPLLCSVVTQTQAGRFYWKPFDGTIEIQRGIFFAEGIDLNREPALKITLNEQPENQSDLWLEVHHSAADATGIERFLEDILIEYSTQKGFLNRELLLPREPVDLSLLQHRGRYGQTCCNFFWNFSRLIFGLERAGTFLFNKIIPLVPQKTDISQNQPPTGFPAIISRQFNEEETQRIKTLSKSQHVTINDLFLCSLFLAINNWQQRENQTGQRGRIRIAVPINLRTPNDHLMPAANIVSMVFLDRKPKQIQNIQNKNSFLQKIHREMMHIKKHHLGLALIYGLAVYRKLFGSYKKMIDRNRCWTTAVASNLGSLFSQTPCPRRNGNLLFDTELELMEIHSVPPIRPQSAIGVCISSYANRLTVNMQYDVGLLNEEQANRLFDFLTAEL